MRNHIFIVTLLAASLGLAGTAAAAEKNLNFGYGEVGAGASDVVENEYDAYLYDAGQAASNCQFLLGVQTLVVSVAAVDHLGLITDEDTFDLLREFREMGDIEAIFDDDYFFENAGVAPCEQHVGAVRVSVTTSDGFGAAAPLGSAASALGAESNGRGGGGGNANLALGKAEAGAYDVVRNTADTGTEDDGVAVSNCQILVAWQTSVTSLAGVEQSGTIEDSDSTTIDENPDIAPEGRGDIVVTDDDTREDIDGGRATCVQTVESITLSQGPIRIPPSS